MSARFKGEYYTCASSGDSKMTFHGQVTHAPDTHSPAEYRFPPASPSRPPFVGNDASASSASSPSDSRSASPSTLPTSPFSQVPSAVPGGTLAFTLPRPPPLTGGLEFVHPTPGPASPQLPPYRPLPPLSPVSILSTLDNIANSAPKKKSHARKQPAGHIPRPRNAFILFRCLFVSQQAVPASVEKDHRNISRIAGKVWKSMSESERDPWIKAADVEKARHEQRWPGYRYNPVQTQALRRPYVVSRRPGPPSGPGPDERRGRTMARTSAKAGVHSRMKYEDEDTVPFPSSYLPQPHLHAPLARVASVPPRSSRPQGLFQQWRGDDLDAQDADGDAEMMPPPHEFASFTMPAPTTPTPMNNHSARLPASGSSSGSYVYDAPFPPASPPPPPPIPMSLRLSTRRSSSCPPLPPPGLAPYPFDNPNTWNSMATSFASAYADLDADVYQSPSEPESPSPLPFRNPFSSTASRNPFPTQAHGDSHLQSQSQPSSSSRSAAHASRPSTPPAFTNPFTSSSPFAYAFPGYNTGDSDVQVPGQPKPEIDEQHRPLTAPYEHRPLTAPEHHFPPLRHAHMHNFNFPAPRHMHVDGMGAGSRLMHRRGSSLDRAIASSSIAGAIGGLSRSGLGLGHAYGHGYGLASQQWGETPLHQHHQHHQHGSMPREPPYVADSNTSQQGQYFVHQSGHAKMASDASLCSSGTGTPALSSPSPPSSFEGSCEAQAQSQPHARPRPTGMFHAPEDTLSGITKDGTPIKMEDQGQQLQHVGADRINDMSVCPPLVQESFLATPPSPPTPSPTEPHTIIGSRKISARLFGSQGARLGLDLDLDVPLSLDVSYPGLSKRDGNGDGDDERPATATSPPYSSVSASTSYSSVSASTSYSSLSTSTSYSSIGSYSPVGVSTPYTTSTRDPNGGTVTSRCSDGDVAAGKATADSTSSAASPASAFPPYTPTSPQPFSYTQALMDDEFKFRACTSPVAIVGAAADSDS